MNESSAWHFIQTGSGVTRRVAFTLESSHWPAGGGPGGQPCDWSSDASRWGTLTQEVYNLRGSLNACMVVFEEIQTKQGLSQSHDEERVTVEFVVGFGSFVGCNHTP